MDTKEVRKMCDHEIVEEQFYGYIRFIRTKKGDRTIKSEMADDLSYRCFKCGKELEPDGEGWFKEIEQG